MKNRRTTRRYDLSLPIIVRASREKEVASGTGSTRDVSTSGVYFTIDCDLNIGAELHMELTLPAGTMDGAEVFVKVTGKVVRVDKRFGNGDQHLGIAAMFERYEIVRKNAAARPF